MVWLQEQDRPKDDPVQANNDQTILRNGLPIRREARAPHKTVVEPPHLHEQVDRTCREGRKHGFDIPRLAAVARFCSGFVAEIYRWWGWDMNSYI